MTLRVLWLMVLVVAGGCTSTPGDDSSGNPLVTDRNHSIDWAVMHGVSAASEVDSCKVCHGADYLGGTVNVSCLACHLSGPPFSIHTASWTNTVNDHQTFATIASWTKCANAYCHGTDLDGGSIGGASRGPSCLSGCHTTGNNAGQPDAPHGNYDPTTTPGNHGLAAKADMVYCRNCHGRPENTFDGGFVTGILGDPSGISANCSSSSCHPDAMAHPTNWQGGNDVGGYASSHRNNGVVQAVINNSCALCHKVDGAGAGPLGGAPSCFGASFTNANGSATSCHANGPGPFHMDTHFSWAGTCANCHAGTSIVADVHNNTCSLCHVSASGGGTLKAGTDGTAVGKTTASTCLSCHPAATYPADGIHHTNGGSISYTVNNNCTYCHADPRGVGAAWNNGATPPTSLHCLDCHGSPVNRLTPAVSGADYSTVTATQVHNLPGTIDNYGMCFSCHDNDTTDNAPIVTTLHAKPPTWTAPAFRAGDNCANGVAADHPGRTEIGFFFTVLDAWDGGAGPGDEANKGGTENDCHPPWPDTVFVGSSGTFAVPSVPGNGNTGGTVPLPN